MPEEVQILLVEDDENDAELALRALRRSGLPGNVAHARDGEEALAFLFGPAAPDGRSRVAGLRVIFLDLKLPKVDGLEVLQRVRSDPRTQGIPVVILTSSMLPADIAACYRAGANSFVVKRVDFEGHAQALREMGNYWLRLNVVQEPA